MDTGILTRMQNLCSRRECCSSDLKVKIKSALSKSGQTASDADVGQILDSLRKDGFFSDARYASAFARDKALLDGWGPIKITAALSAKGISGDIAAEAVEEAFSDSKSADRLSKILASKARTLSGDPQKELKLIRFALGRGYKYEQVKNLIHGISFD
ncbi:MAG: RecX family transcriptional regulator [Bacteroidales bacterium]|nr:RecX family transcriptional regulator [Bacteroidales bacterium]